jgi:hypothetical protein
MNPGKYGMAVVAAVLEAAEVAEDAGRVSAL